MNAIDLMGRRIVLAVFAVSAIAAKSAVLDEDVVVYYDFDTMAFDPNKPANIANPGVMDLAGGGNWSTGSYPVEASPAEKNPPIAFGGNVGRFRKGAPDNLVGRGAKGLPFL